MKGQEMHKMLKIRRFSGFLAISAGLWLLGGRPAWGADVKLLPGHVPAVLPNLTAKGDLPATNLLRLAVGLPLRDRAGLDKFVAEVSDPASPKYRQFLTREELAARFGPTEADYESVVKFARTNGLSVSGRHSSRLLLEVTAPVAAVEQAFHVKLRTYRHPTEDRDFFAPDTEPSVDAGLPVVDIQGLSDYYRPHPLLARPSAAEGAPRTGSAPDGSGGYFGNDFINAYVPGTALTGAGQSVGLVEFDGYYASDIAKYASNAGNGRTLITVQPALVEGVSGLPGYSGIANAVDEVSLDIEMAMAIAPGLSRVVVYEGATQNGVLTRMLEDSNSVNSMSSSWGWSGGPVSTTDVLFESMGAVGESFFTASGDSDAYTTGASSANGADNPSLQNSPASNPYLTAVGGTTLTMNGTGASYASETVWNWGYDANAGAYVGSSGGISSYYGMPAWQAGVSNLAAAGGSTSFRNTPDVALTADNVFVYFGGGSTGNFGGTSCAAPLWAGFTALMNQQNAINGRPPLGFLNPALYTIAAGSNYGLCFNDITTGNNFSGNSLSLFYATNGYDLCTGLGTPNGQNLILALAGWPDVLRITPFAGFTASGPAGGPFTGTTASFALTNSSSSNLTWSVSNSAPWLAFTPSNGVLAGGQGVSVTAALTASASTLPAGNYSATAWFTDESSGVSQARQFNLQALQPLAISPSKGFSSIAPIGGSFSITSGTFVLTNLGQTSLNWQVVHAPFWLNASPVSGTLAAGGSAPLTVNLNVTTATIGVGSYTDSLLLTNLNGGTANLPFTLQVNPVVQNGGFETGDFTGWTLSGSSYYNYVTPASQTPDFVHAGSYGAALGQYNSLASLTQNLTTTPGQQYLLSLWLANPSNPYGYTPNQFEVIWNGTTLYNHSSLRPAQAPSSAWNSRMCLTTWPWMTSV
jgi:hypothetical protein